MGSVRMLTNTRDGKWDSYVLTNTGSVKWDRYMC